MMKSSFPRKRESICSELAHAQLVDSQSVKPLGPRLREDDELVIVRARTRGVFPLAINTSDTSS